ncbi:MULTISPECIES: putative baseplate assembly protein [unclassified Microcoleus]|uniref:putative baseplate assembly protein n=1 Tax=unclassified Microcoleus TaxID=2642155 RepID=UPI002FD368FC
MSIQPPKIDDRSYEDIVAQTEALVEDFTISEVLPQDFEKLLLGRTLAEEVKDEHGLIASFSGKVIDKDLVDKIIKIQGLKRVKVKGWQPPGSSEIDPKDKSRLAGLILNQDLKDGKAKIIATRGTVIDTVLAEKLSKIEGLSRVKVKMQPPGSIEVEPNALVGRTLDQDVKDNNDTIATRGTVVDATLAERISQISSLKVVKVKVETDAGRGLIRIFGRMAALVSDRLNQAPDKNFLAFLDLIGTQLLPPQPAKVPLTFSLVERSPVDALVPAHTQVAAPPADEQEEEVVFETDGELVVTTAQLKAVFVREPEKDKYSDRTSQATGKKDAAFEAFTAEQPIEHCLYLACDELFTLPGNKTITLEFYSSEATDLAKLLINWSYWDGSWQVLKITENKLIDGKLEVVTQNFPVLTNQTINGIEAGWLKASLNQPLLEALLDKDAIKGTTLDEEAVKGKTQLKLKDITNINLVNNIIRVAGSSNQEDCKIISIDSEIKTLTLETPLQYSHPKDTRVWFLKLPIVNNITASAKIEQNNLTPDFCFFNTVPLDLSKDFYPFGEQPRFNDTLYIASKEVFARPGAIVTIDLQLSNGLPVKIDGGVEMAWEAWNGHTWEQLEKAILETTLSEKAIAGSTTIKVKSTKGFVTENSIRIAPGGSTQEDNIIEAINNEELELKTRLSKDQETKTSIIQTSPSTLTGSGKVSLTLPSKIDRGTVNGETCYWIRARIVKGDYGKPAIIEKSPDSNTPPVFMFSEASFQPPSVESLSLSYSYEASGSLSACCAYNDFHYVEFLTTALREKAQSKEKILKLASVAGLAVGDRLWIDRTEEQEIEAIDLEQRTVTVQPVLAADRDAGKLVEFFTTLKAEAKKGETIFKLSSVKHFRVGDRLRIVTTNGSTTQEYECEVEAVNVDRQTVTIRSALTLDLVEKTKVMQSFQPFKTTADRYPALYLGFDKPFANRHTSLFAQVEPPQSVQPSNTEPVRLVWEYASPSGWSWLGVQDETNTFAERGLIQFIGPTDWEKTSEFGQELFWLRVNWQQGQFRVPPRLRRLLTNTMWATQAITLENEILGSSDGTTSQIFRTVQKPVLQGEQLEVQEVKIPSAEERAAIESLEGNEAVKVFRDEAGEIEAVWVRWHKVRDFYGSGPRDRHYVLDRLTGEVRFGDGQYGMVPPQGRNNIRFGQYQTGGGTRGNLAANTVVQLKTTVPYIEKVTNLEAAGGGTEQESIDRVKERGPKFLRHRDRAVTIQDFEDLAYEASPDVARAKAIAPTFKQKSQDQKDNPPFDPLDPDLWLDPKKPKPDEGEIEKHNKAKADNAGQIRILIVPRTTAPQPVPSLALIDLVKAYMRERCDPCVYLQVTGPEWQAASVTAEVVPKSLETADAVRTAVVEQLEKFLHPLTGGKKGQGWALGRLPQQSDLYAEIQSIRGVDHVRSLKVEPDPQTKDLSPEQLIYSGTHTISSILPKEGA